jgi:hypothetical protein
VTVRGGCAVIRAPWKLSCRLQPRVRLVAQVYRRQEPRAFSSRRPGGDGRSDGGAVCWHAAWLSRATPAFYSFYVLLRCPRYSGPRQACYLVCAGRWAPGKSRQRRRRAGSTPVAAPVARDCTWPSCTKVWRRCSQGRKLRLERVELGATLPAAHAGVHATHARSPLEPHRRVAPLPKDHVRLSGASLGAGGFACC